MPEGLPIPSIRRRWGITIVLVVAILAGCSLGVRWIFEPPGSIATAEDMLERDLIAYQVWDGTPVIVWTMGYETSEGRNLVFVDRLRLDPVPMDLPPRPRWQWTGQWNYVDGATDPATVGYMHEAYGRAIYGSITDSAVTTIEVDFAGTWMAFDVTAPGFLIRLADNQPNPGGYRWLDADGVLIFEKNDDRSGL